MLKIINRFLKSKSNKCEHEFAEFRKVEPYQNLNGYRVYSRCEKCGYIKETYFKSE